MYIALAPCPACARHVRVSEDRCPFCAADVAGLAPPVVPIPPVRRLRRAFLLTMGATLAGCGGVAGEDSGPADTGSLPTLYGDSAVWDTAPVDAGEVGELYGMPPVDGGVDAGVLE